jgi:hypothetical protein
MRGPEPRSFAEVRELDPDDPVMVEAFAVHCRVEPDEVTAAIEQVGPNRTAVEIWLGCASL